MCVDSSAESQNSLEEQSQTPASNIGTESSQSVLDTDTNPNITNDETIQSGTIILDNNSNASDSENTAVVDSPDISTTIQTNEAQSTVSVREESIAGGNSASENTGGNNEIITGTATASGSILNVYNTNAQNVLYTEYTVGNQIGDYVLDLDEACTADCIQTPLFFLTSDSNGSESTNTATLFNNQNTSLDQTNVAYLYNDLVLLADTGNNQANDNTGGDSTIITDDAYATGNILNFVNNNLAGNVIYSVVNVVGDLVGNIILPVGYALGLVPQDITLNNLSNGSQSSNTATVDSATDLQLTQLNTADIRNILDLSATTGQNSLSDNTGGNNDLTTGNAYVDANILNIANTDVSGGDWLIVFINESGNWIGKIIGLYGDSHIAGTYGAQFQTVTNPADSVDTINISNTQNGVNSDNTQIAQTSSDSTTTQTNNADVVNQAELQANTGGNSTSANTNGNNTIRTGNANVVLNIANFVNNNVANGARILFTVINVFGSWVGDFVFGEQNENENAVTQTAQNSDSPNENSEDLNTNSAENSASDEANNEDESDNSSQVSQKEINNESALQTGDSLISDASSIVLGAYSENSGPQLNVGVGLVSENPTQKRVVRINLAWVLLGILALVVLYFSQRIAHRFLTKLKIQN